MGYTTDPIPSFARTQRATVTRTQAQVKAEHEAMLRRRRLQAIRNARELSDHAKIRRAAAR